MKIKKDFIAKLLYEREKNYINININLNGRRNGGVPVGKYGQKEAVMKKKSKKPLTISVGLIFSSSP